jgi:Domain of unknown function (DUF3395)
MAPPRIDEDLNNGSSSSYIHPHFEDLPRHQRESEWVSTQQVVPYDESSAFGTASTTRREKRGKKKKNRWSPSSSSSSTSSSIQPRAEIVFPLQWNNDAASLGWPVWDRRTSKITASATLPLYRSQDALLDSDQTIMPKYRQEIFCNVSMTTLQQDFQNANLFGSCHLRATHYHDNDDTDRPQKTSLVLSTHRQRHDVITLGVENVGQSYSVSAITVWSPSVSHNNNNNYHYRIVAHRVWKVAYRYHRRHQPFSIKIRPDIRIAANSPAAGISIIHDGGSSSSSTNNSGGSSSIGRSMFPQWNLRCGCIYDTKWKPTVRLHWSFPFAGHVQWTYGGATSSTSTSGMIQYEASWKAKTSANSALAMSVTTQDILHAATCRWMISYTLSDVTIRIPIIIAAATSWQSHLLYWGLASTVSQLVHGIVVQDMLGRSTQRPRPRQGTPRRGITDEEQRGGGGGGQPRHTALMQQHFMKRQAAVRYRDEENRNGLLIEQATYRYRTIRFDVTIPLRFWVADSKLELFADSKRSLMLGFYNLADDYVDNDDDNDDDAKEKQTKSTWVDLFKDAVQSFLAPTTTSAESASSKAATTTSRQSKKQMDLKIVYRFHGTRYSIIVGDEEHVVLPSVRAKEIAG